MGRNGSDLLLVSDKDMIQLGRAVESRFLDLCKLHLRVRGTQLDIPPSMDLDFYYWRRMMIRFKKRDYRNSLSEKLSTRSVAQWTLDVNCELRNQTRKVLVWKD